MRILFIASRDWTHPASAGGDILASESARFMASRGHQVTYLCSSYPGGKTDEYLDGVRIKRLSSGASLAIRVCIEYLKHYRGKVDLVYEDALGGAKLPFFAPLYVREPMISVWHQRSSLIISHQYPPPIRPFLNFAEKLTAFAHRNTIIRVPSHDRVKELVELGLPLKNIRVVTPNIPDAWGEFTPDTTKREPLIVWLGKIRRYKCPHLVIQAMQEVVQLNPQARLLIAGKREDIEYERELEELAETLGIADRVEIKTNIDENEKREILSKARALVLFSPIEGFGIVILEANACGTPAIVSDGVPEDAVRQDYNGVRVPFADIQALATAISRLLNDSEFFHRLSGNAVAFAKGFTLSRIGEKFEALALETAGVRMNAGNANKLSTNVPRASSEEV